MLQNEGMHEVRKRVFESERGRVRITNSVPRVDGVDGRIRAQDNAS